MNELKGINLGDARLDKRAILMLEEMLNSPKKTINSTFKSWSETKAAYRFLDNESVTLEKILQPHLGARQKREQVFNVILHVQDYNTNRLYA